MTLTPCAPRTRRHRPSLAAVDHFDAAGWSIPGSGCVEQADGRTVEIFSLDRHPRVEIWRWLRWLLAIISVVASLAVMIVDGGRYRSEPRAIGFATAPLTVVVLGDTSAGRDGCPGCRTYVDQVSSAWSNDGRRHIRVDGLTAAADAAPSSMQALLESLHIDPNTRSAVQKADVIVLAMGSGDVTRAPASTSCPSLPREECPTAISPRLRHDLTAWITETDKLRDHRPLILRVVTPPPTSGLPSQTDVARNACQIVAAHGGACVNLYNLTRKEQHLVTPTDQRHPQLTQHGHDLIATELTKLGLN